MKNLFLFLTLFAISFQSYGTGRITTKIESQDIGLWAYIQRSNLLNIVEQNLYDNKITAINSDGESVMSIIESKADTLFKSGQKNQELFGIENDYGKLKKQEFNNVLVFYMYDSIVLNNDSLEFIANHYTTGSYPVFNNNSYIPEYVYYKKYSPHIKISFSEILKVVDDDVKLYLDIFKNNNMYLQKGIHKIAVELIDNFNDKLRKTTLSGKYRVYYNDSFTNYFQNDSLLFYSISNKFINDKIIPSFNIDTVLQMGKKFDSLSNDLLAIWIVLESNTFEFKGISASKFLFFGGSYIGKEPFGYLRIIDIKKDSTIEWVLYDLIIRKSLSTKLKADYDHFISAYNSEMGLE